MAGLGWRKFNAGEVLTANNFQSYGVDQTVQVYAGTAARGSAIGTAVAEGMVSYLADTNDVQVYDGSNWNPLSQLQSPNVIINGAFDIWQRSTSTTSLGWASADRFWVNNSAGTTTIARESTIVPTGFIYSQKLTQSVANGNVISVQPIESNNSIPLQGKTVTLSAYVYGSVSTAFTFDFNYSTSVDVAPGGSWTSISPSSGGSGTATASWQRVSGTYVIPSTAKSLRVGLNVTSLVSGNSFYWTGVQLEAGSAISTFKRNGSSIQGELSACQRYYQRWNAQGAYGPIAGSGFFTGSTNGRLMFKPYVPFRTIPSSIVISNFGMYDAAGVLAVTGSYALVGNSATSEVGADFTTSGATTYRHILGYDTGAGGGYVAISAEL